MLLPDKSMIVSLLRLFRAWEVVLLAEPHDLAGRRHLEDDAYTLCVLMGQRTRDLCVLMGQRTTRDAISEAKFCLGWARSVVSAAVARSRDGGNSASEKRAPRG
ncbi:DUF5133 domain-containing protein [Streptomyces sp. NPDC057748]|uniref:DUF5133 domain-containing protein n=1 Tax=unclassified Streptomyces TaxID=2593676 RepID=UPI0036CE6071